MENNFYCKEQSNVGYTCEDGQCDACAKFEQPSKATELPEKPNFWNEIAKMQKDCGTYREHYSKDEQSAMYDMAETIWRLFVEPLQLKEAEAEVYNKLMFEQNTALQSRVAQLEGENQDKQIEIDNLNRLLDNLLTANSR